MAIIISYRTLIKFVEHGIMAYIPWWPSHWKLLCCLSNDSVLNKKSSKKKESRWSHNGSFHILHVASAHIVFIRLCPAATAGHVSRILLSPRTLWCLSQSAVTCFTYRLLVRFHDNSAFRFQRGLGPFLHLFRFRFKWQLLLKFSGNHEWIKMTSLAFHRLKIKKKHVFA